MQPIPISKINTAHPRTHPALIARITLLDGLDPELAQCRIAIGSQAQTDQRIAVSVVGGKIRCWSCGTPADDEGVADGEDIPAAECDGAGGFEVHGCAEED